MNAIEVGQILSFVGGVMVGIGITLAAAAVGVAVFLWRQE